MRCVTRNPPTALIVARVTASIPTKEEKFVPDATMTAPTKVIPLIAFEPDISGVCRVGGTFVITSKPTKTASTKIVKLAIRS